ncbi:MAG: DUF5011 domain-containing protein [Ruminococcaceae bacterium]|nr:DUF5011 domain-containing protein [Oscillospiraceae bacterium]
MRIGIGNKRVNLRIYVGTAKLYVLWCVAALCVLCVASGCVCLALELQFTRCVIEAGQTISAADITGDGSATFADDFSPDMLMRSGVYYVTAHTSRGDVRVRLRVQDTKAPDVVVKDVYFAVGTQPPSPMDYIESVYEPSEFYGEYLNELPELTRIGSNVMKIRFVDCHGNKTDAFEVRMTQIYDRLPPVILAPEVIVAQIGDKIDYSLYISLEDNCVGKLDYTVDDSAVDVDTEGEYEVLVTATDAAGNKEKATVKVSVQKSEPDNESQD